MDNNQVIELFINRGMIDRSLAQDVLGEIENSGKEIAEVLSDFEIISGRDDVWPIVATELGADLVEHLAHPCAGVFQHRCDLVSLLGSQAQFIRESLDRRLTSTFPLRRLRVQLGRCLESPIDGDAARGPGRERDEQKQGYPDSRSTGTHGSVVIEVRTTSRLFSESSGKAAGNSSAEAQSMNSSSRGVSADTAIVA